MHHYSYVSRDRSTGSRFLEHSSAGCTSHDANLRLQPGNGSKRCPGSEGINYPGSSWGREHLNPDAICIIIRLAAQWLIRSLLCCRMASFNTDDAASRAQHAVSVNGHDTTDIGFDLAHAQISAATGQIGALGKHIEASGQSPSTALVEKLVIDVYDDFPTVAFISASFTNSGSDDLQLDSLAMVERSLNAALMTSVGSLSDVVLPWGQHQVGQG